MKKHFIGYELTERGKRKLEAYLLRFFGDSWTAEHYYAEVVRNLYSSYHSPDYRYFGYGFLFDRHFTPRGMVLYPCSEGTAWDERLLSDALLLAEGYDYQAEFVDFKNKTGERKWAVAVY